MCSGWFLVAGMSVALLAEMMTGAMPSTVAVGGFHITSSFAEYLKEISILGKNNK